ncbi:hypothetical protein Godav_023425, partial [Gossypium davidsonii]|nr:hypothetical protein [Gossypium davidsonii]
ISIEPTFVEGSFTPPTLTDFKNSIGEASSQINRTLGKRKAIPPKPEVWSHFTKSITSDGVGKAKCNYYEK